MIQRTLIAMKKLKIVNLDGDLMDLDTFLRGNIEKNEQDVKQRIAEERQNRINAIVKESGMKKRFKTKTFDNFTITQELQKTYSMSLEFAQNFETKEKGLLLSGTVGSGKTHLVSAIANYLIGNLYTVIYGNVTDIIAK